MKTAIEKTISTKQIGDGQLPNKYWVSIANDYYYINDGVMDWISDKNLFEVKGKTIKVFSTYKAAQEFINDDLYLGMTYDDIKVNCISIEDRFTGQLYEQYRVFDAESATIEDYQIMEDTKFTVEAMAKLGAEFV